ncbi:RNA polymerase sigma factor [Streptomyces bobili]
MSVEDALSTDLDLAEPLEATPQPGIQLAGVLHDEQYAALVRFLLLMVRPGPTEAQDAFTHMCVPGVSSTHPRAWLRTVAWRSWVSQQVTLEETCAELPEPQPSLRWHTPAHAAELGEEERRVVSLLLQLPAKQRAAMAWHLDGFTRRRARMPWAPPRRPYVKTWRVHERL